MKKLYSIILTILVALAFAPIVSAQSAQDYSIEGFIKEKYGSTATIQFHHDDVKLPAGKFFGYSKGISSPFSDGNYWIKLESFATGSAESEVKPADIVLVLDFSGSMTNYYGPAGYHYDLVAESYTYGSTPFGDNASEDQLRYYYYGGKYYRVYRGRTDSGETFGRYSVTKYWQYLYIETDNGTFYLDDMSLVKTEPHKYSNDPNDGLGGNNAVIWKGALFRYV